MRIGNFAFYVYVWLLITFAFIATNLLTSEMLEELKTNAHWIEMVDVIVKKNEQKCSWIHRIIFKKISLIVCILIMGFMIISQFLHLSKFENSSHSYDQQRKRVIKCYTSRNDRESDRLCVCTFACMWLQFNSFSNELFWVIWSSMIAKPRDSFLVFVCLFVFFSYEILLDVIK